MFVPQLSLPRFRDYFPVIRIPQDCLPFVPVVEGEVSLVRHKQTRPLQVLLEVGVVCEPLVEVDVTRHFYALVRLDDDEEQRVDGVLQDAAIPVLDSAANRLIGEVLQSRRRPLLGPSPG